MEIDDRTMSALFEVLGSNGRWPFCLSEDILLLIVAGLLFVAIGLPISIVFGKSRQAGPISIGCFSIGLIAIPVFIFVLMTLGGLGVIDLD